jgi:hypothetical protein
MMILAMMTWFYLNVVVYSKGVRWREKRAMEHAEWEGRKEKKREKEKESAKKDEDEGSRKGMGRTMEGEKVKVRNEDSGVELRELSRRLGASEVELRSVRCEMPTRYRRKSLSMRGQPV